MQVYVAGDHLDGMQAVATGTTSPLGDFLDHYCDLWAGGILVFGFWTLLGTAGREALFFMHACLILGFAVTYAERETHRALHFTRYGTLEAIVVLTVFFLSWAIPGARVWWQSPMVAGLPWYTLIGATGAIMALSAVVIIVRRMGTVPMPVAVFTAGLVALAYLVATRTDIRPIEGWLVMALYGAVYVARVMHGHLVKGTRSWPDRLATIAIVTLTIWSMTIDPAFESIRTAVRVLGAYLLVSAAYALVRIIGSLRRYWSGSTRPAQQRLDAEVGDGVLHVRDDARNRAHARVGDVFHRQDHTILTRPARRHRMMELVAVEDHERAGHRVH